MPLLLKLFLMSYLGIPVSSGMRLLSFQRNSIATVHSFIHCLTQPHVKIHGCMTGWFQWMKAVWSCTGEFGGGDNGLSPSAFPGVQHMSWLHSLHVSVSYLPPPFQLPPRKKEDEEEKKLKLYNTPNSPPLLPISPTLTYIPLLFHKYTCTAVLVPGRPALAMSAGKVAANSVEGAPEEHTGIINMHIETMETAVPFISDVLILLLVS